MPTGIYKRTDEQKRLVTLNLPTRIKRGKYVKCKICPKTVYQNPSGLRSYCSRDCSNRANAPLVSKLMKGRKVSEKTREKLRGYKGEKASSWKGGKPNCPDCGKQLSYGSKHCSKCKMSYRTKEHQNKLNHSISNAMIGKAPLNNSRAGKFGNITRGWFNINGKRMFFRSKWEANYALYLDFLIKQNQIQKWSYEEDVFIFHKIQFGTRSYKPDFKIFNNDGSIEYHEVKGYMDAKSKTKLKRMKKYYPQIKIILIEREYYNSIKDKIGRLLGFY